MANLTEFKNIASPLVGFEPRTSRLLLSRVQVRIPAVVTYFFSSQKIAEFFLLCTVYLTKSKCSFKPLKKVLGSTKTVTIMHLKSSARAALQGDHLSSSGRTLETVTQRTRGKNLVELSFRLLPYSFLL